ncbi:hypothetical protein ACP70R_041595 [Stipagrostis hirtigluma subsp. patula]
MASRRFFAYDPYDYYYPSPYHYPYPYYHHQPTPARSVEALFPAAEDAEPAAMRTPARPRTGSSRSISIPVQFVRSDPEPERETARMPVAAPVPRKRAPSAEEAAVRMQAAARGFLARRTVRAVREVEREAEEVAARVAREAEALRGDARARIAAGEALMRLLLRLDAVRGAREYRKRVTKRVLALQDAVDALEPSPAPAPAAVAEEPEADAAEEAAVEMAEGESRETVAPAQTEATVNSCEGEAESTVETADGMEVDGDRASGEANGAEETEHAPPGVADLDGDKPDDADTVDDWEMVPEVEPEPAADTEASLEAPGPQEPAGQETRNTANAGAAADGGLDARKVMEMVAALCERNAQQCAVIGALAERVDALERAVRRVEDAERRRRRGKKLRKEGKGSNHSSCYSDQGF